MRLSVFANGVTHHVVDARAYAACGAVVDSGG